MNIFNNRGCFGGPPKQQESPAPAPQASPLPTAVPSEIAPQGADEARKRRLQAQRYGMASTITTSARGLTGTGANLTNQSQSGKLKTGL